MIFNLNTILQIVTLLGVLFAIYQYFRKPQEKSEIVDAQFELKLSNLEATVTNLRDNHIHTLQNDLNKHIQDNHTFALETTKSLSKIETLLEQHLKQ